MSEIAFDVLDNHLQHQPDLASAMVPMGMLLAWAANQHLLATAVVEEHERLILRIRFQEARGSELLAVCGGDLLVSLFNEDGQAFLTSYYPRYMRDYALLFDKQVGTECYVVPDDIEHYQRVAQMLTDQFMRSLGRRRSGARDGVSLVTQMRRWWSGLWG
ncbi:MAG: hypothetical protein AAF993_16050 [Pseudomonadota bacterium]